jgi:hypothetical protein
MVAFEILVNGHHIRTITAGEFGMLNADVMWAKIQTKAGPICEEFRVMPRGMEGNEGDALHWPDADLKIGDIVTIRIVEVERPGDEPHDRWTRDEIQAMRSRHNDTP